MNSSVNFTIKISPYMNVVPRTAIYNLKYKKSSNILNHNRFIFNDVLTEMVLKAKEKKQFIKDAILDTMMDKNLRELLFLME